MDALGQRPPAPPPTASTGGTGRRLRGEVSTPIRIGRYLVTGTLGRGGMGVVYRGIDLERDLDLAIKTLPTLDAKSLMRLKREFRVMADITHRNLAALYELQTEGDEWFFTMECIDGAHFTDHVLGPRGRPSAAADSSSSMTVVDGPEHVPTRQVARSGMTRRVGSDGHVASDAASTRRPASTEPSPLHRAAEKRLRRALRQLALGVAALHAAGKIHRDLKPSNVMVERATGRVVVLDFGLVEDREAIDGSMIAGTPEYAAPEQLEGYASPASDWYSVGIMLYESLTGQRPFRGNTRELTAAKQRFDVARPDRWMTGIPTDLADLCEALLQRDPASRPREEEILSALGLAGETHPAAPRANTVVIGRERELGVLWERYRAVRAGEARMVFIHGRSGMGKSTVLRTFVDQLRRHEHALVLGGRCYEREALPYKALDSAVDALAATLRMWPEADLAELEIGPELQQAFPVLASILPDDGASDRTPSGGADLVEQRRQAFGGLRRLFGAIASKRSVVVWIDDLQWGDGDSARLLNELWAKPDAPPVLWICTYRDEAVHESELLRLLLTPAMRDSADGAHFIEVGPLSVESCERLARSVAGGSSGIEVGEEQLHEIAGEAAGSPYLVEELARHLTSAAHQGRGAVTLESLLGLRLEALPAQARRLLETVAVAGRPLPQRTAFEAAGLEGTPYATLGLLRSAFLVRTQGVGERDPVETYHDRVREHVLAHLSPEERAGTHRRLARALRATSGSDAHELARHLYEGGDLAEARRFAELAGDHAARALAFEQASSLYAMAIESLQAADPRIRAVLEEKRADALARSGRAGDAAPLFLAAAKSVPSQRARDLRRRAAEQLLVSGRFDEGTAVLRPVLASVGVKYPESPGRALAEVLYRVAVLELRGTRFVERRESSFSLDQLAATDVCWSAVKGLLSVDSIRAALFIVRSLQEALRIGEPLRIARALTIYGMVQVFEGAPRGVARGNRLLDQAREISAGLSDPYLDGIGDTCRGTAEMSVGHWRDGLRLMERGIEQLRTRCTGVTWEINATVSSTFNTRLWLGDMAGIRHRADAWGREAVGLGDLFATVTAELYTALTELAAGSPDGARRLVNLAMSRWTHSVFTYQTWLALKVRVLCDLYEGRPNMAHERLLRSWNELERSHLLRVQLMLIDAHLLRATTGLAKASARSDASLLARVEGDARALERLGRPTARGAAALVRAGLDRLRSERESEQRELRAAITHFDSVGVALHAACARVRLGEALGGAAGAREQRGALQAMKRCGIDDPLRWLLLYAPAEAPPR